MRCEKCRKEITGIGKPAVPPAIPAILAWGGALWAMWSLTLGENPLPGWTPKTGWTVGLATLAGATVLAWLALVRRKCPGCGSTRMLQAMEEESVLATERRMAQEQAVSELRLGAEDELRQSLAESLRSEIEAELHAASSKQVAELRVRLEKELRDEIGQSMRAGQIESERRLRQKVASELRPEIESELRPRIEERLRSEIESELRPRIEERLRPEIESELRPRIEKDLRPEIEKELRVSLEKPAESVPEEVKTSPPEVEAPKAGPEMATDSGKPAGSKTAGPRSETSVQLPGLPAAVRRPPPVRATPAPPYKAVTADADKSSGLSVPAGSPPPARATPAPASTAVTADAVKSGKPGESGPMTTPGQKHLPGFPTTLSKNPSPVSAKPAAAGTSKTPPPASTRPTAPASSKGSGLTPIPVADKMAVTPVPVTDPRERAERRARVIVSDLSLYHKDLLTKAAQAADPKMALGTLWRDAVLAYDQAVPLDVRNGTNLLEEELHRYLRRLRQNQTAAADAQQG